MYTLNEKILVFEEIIARVGYIEIQLEALSV